MTFRDLHRPGDPFVLFNVWDRGSARMMEALGAEALATSSAAHAFTLGRADGTVTRDEALSHAQDILGAVRLPVSGDFENGFGHDPDDVAETVRLAAEVGLAGISVEDILPGTPDAYEAHLAVERIRAAAAAARALPRDFVLVARADGVMTGNYDIEEALARIRAFDDAGADCLYVPLPKTRDDLARVIAATTKPVNVLVAGPYAAMTRAAFAGLGAARLSLGASLARVTHAAIRDAGRAMLVDGDFSALGRAAPGAEIDALLRRSDA